MKTYLINLDRSIERLSYMTSQLNRLRVDFERIPAVDGRELDASAFSSASISLSELGCYLSHITAWRKLCDGSDEFALILEDDVRLSQSLPNVAGSCDWVPDNVDLVKLETSTMRISVGRQGLPAPANRSLHRLLKRDICTGGYIIRRKLAERFLEESTLSVPVDVFMFDKESVQVNRIYQMNPAMVVQEQFLDHSSSEGLQSTILPERFERYIAELSQPGPLKRLNRAVFRPIEPVGKWLRRFFTRHKARELQVEFR